MTTNLGFILLSRCSHTKLMASLCFGIFPPQIASDFRILYDKAQKWVQCRPCWICSWHHIHRKAEEDAYTYLHMNFDFGLFATRWPNFLILWLRNLSCHILTSGGILNFNFYSQRKLKFFCLALIHKFINMNFNFLNHSKYPSLCRHTLRVSSVSHEEMWRLRSLLKSNSFL